ncbi:MAG: hypothetical protein ACRC2K_06815 [Clostridium sp.]
MRKEKLWIVSFFIIVSFLLFTVGYKIYKIDPYQQYSYNNPTKEYIEDRAMYIQRQLTPGFAKNLDYETILAGSSMSETILRDSMDKILNTKSAKLSISGATPYEIRNVLNTAINTGKVKTALVSVDLYMYNNEVEYRREPYPSHLYDNNPFNDLKYLLNYKILSDEAIKLEKSREESPEIFDLNELYKDKPSTVYAYDTVIPKYDLPLYSELPEKNYEKDIEEVLNPSTRESDRFLRMKKNFEENLLKVVKNNPQVNFKIYFPPYSILFWNTQSTSGDHTMLLAFKLMMFEELSKYSNVEVYDFQDVESITHNYNYYKDTSHFSPVVGDILLNFIKNEENLLTKDNYIDKMKNLMKQLGNVNYEALKEKSSKQ